MSKSAKLYRIERDEAIQKCFALQRQLDEAQDEITIMKYYKPHSRVVVRIDISGYGHKNFLDFLLRSNQLGGLHMDSDNNWLDIIGVESPEQDQIIQWQDNWGKQPQILNPPHIKKEDSNG